MSKLIANVAVDGNWYGPAYGNADQVPAEVAAQITNPAAWDGAGDAVVAAPAPEGSDGVPVDVPGTPEPDPETEAVADLLGDHADDEVPDPEAVDPLAALAGVDDDKQALLAFRDLLGLDVDGRLGVEKLRAAIEAALTS